MKRSMRPRCYAENLGPLAWAPERPTARFVVVDSGRPDWDTHFLTLARAVALRAACNRAQHGAVMVSQTQRVVATGYNGAFAGMTQGSDGGCPRGQLSYADLVTAAWPDCASKYGSHRDHDPTPARSLLRRGMISRREISTRVASSTSRLPDSTSLAPSESKTTVRRSSAPTVTLKGA